MSAPWIGVDLDGTLAEYDGWKGYEIGAPVPAMVARVKQWLADGYDVRVLTARALDDEVPTKAAGQPYYATTQREIIQAWTLEHIGTQLAVTNAKDMHMVELWDDRAVQVLPNTGIPAAPQTSRVDGL